MLALLGDHPYPGAHTHTGVLSLVHNAELLLVTLVRHRTEKRGQEVGELAAHCLALVLDVCVNTLHLAERTS